MYQKNLTPSECKALQKHLQKIVITLMHNVPNGQIHFQNLEVNSARFLKCVCSFSDSLHQRVNFLIPGGNKRSYVLRQTFTF